MKPTKWVAYKSLNPNSGWFATTDTTYEMSYFKTWREAFDYAYRKAGLR